MPFLDLNAVLHPQSAVQVYPQSAVNGGGGSGAQTMPWASIASATLMKPAMFAPAT